MLSMISFLLLILYSLNLAYLDVWVNRTVRRCSYCSDADLATNSTSPSLPSVLILLVMPLHFFALTFWGFTENPYRGRGGPWVRPGDDLAILVALLIGFCLASQGYFLYQLGKLSGIQERRKLAIDEENRRKQREEFINQYRAQP
ncbi:MAG: hypothetical protein ACLQHF_05090 [Terracidiphilus sp.]